MSPIEIFLQVSLYAIRNELSFILICVFRFNDQKLRTFLSVCTVLDPQYKAEYFSVEEAARVKDILVSECTELYMQDERQPRGEIQTDDGSTSNDRESLTLGSLLRKKRKSYTSSPEVLNAYVSPDRLATSEVDNYLATAKTASQSEPLDWWSQNHGRFPKLSIIARKYLPVVATSVTSERIFSCAGNIVSAKRSRLKPDIIEIMSTLAMNKK